MFAMPSISQTRQALLPSLELSAKGNKQIVAVQGKVSLLMPKIAGLGISLERDIGLTPQITKMSMRRILL